MRINNCCIAIVVAFWASPAFAEALILKNSKAITVPKITQEELVAIRLDSEIYSATEKGFPGLRVFEGDFDKVPYIIRLARTTRSKLVRKTWTASKPELRPLEEGGLEIIVKLLKDDPQPTGLRVVTPLDNFEQQVEVYTSPDGEQWQAAGEAELLFDYTRFMDVRNDVVTFAESANRYFKLVVADPTAEQKLELVKLTRRLGGDDEVERIEQESVERRPFRIDKIEFIREAEQEQTASEAKTDYPVVRFRLEQNEEKQQTIIAIETQREPLTAFSIETPNNNFSRHAVVEVEGTRGTLTNWRQIGEGTLSRIDFKQLSREHLTISFPQTRATKYRIVIDNRDSPPLDISQITANGDVYEVVLMASPGKNYWVGYGADRATPAQYDTVAIEQLLKEGFEPVSAELGEQQSAPGAGRARPLAWVDLLNSKLLLIGVIVVLVIALGWALVFAVQRADNLPEE